jgi:hypothetical protein
MFTLTKGRVAEINSATIAGFTVFVASGALLAIRPVTTFVVLGTLVIFALLIFLTRRLTGLELWQAMVMTALTGYIVFGYGFANLALHIGVPIIIGHGLMFAAVGLVFLTDRAAFTKALREPAVRWALILISFTLVRLLVDVPRYGFYAARDASMFLEEIFLILGFIWAREKRSIDSLMKCLFVVFVANIIYCCSFPWGESLSDWSPKSGIFLAVPLLGNYAGNDIYLLAGALFCVLVGRYAFRLPSWILVFLAAAELLGIAIFQARYVYVDLVVCLVLLSLFGEIRKCAQVAALICLGIGTIWFMTSVIGLELSGRVGPVRLDFLQEHALSLLGDPNAPAAGSISSRMNWYDDVLSRVTSSASTLLIGDGFGRPLIDFSVPSGEVVRQPHNSHLSVLARLGACGFAVWIFFHVSICKRFVYAFRARPRLDPRMSALVLWLLLFYIMVMIEATVQPGLEFSNGAIPVYFLIGFALGVIRWQVGGGLNGTCERKKPAHS